MSNTDDLVTLNSAMTQLMRRIRRIDERQGIGRARLAALAVLHFGGECTLTELAEAEMVSRATMHHIVNGLEGDGYLQRDKDDGDRRRQVLRLTRRGTKAIERAHSARIAYLEHLAMGTDVAELAGAARILDRLRTRAAANSADT